jgi:hypothetical protein
MFDRHRAAQPLDLRHVIRALDALEAVRACWNDTAEITHRRLTLLVVVRKQ